MFWAEFLARYLAEVTIRLVGTEKAQTLSYEAASRANQRADDRERAKWGRTSQPPQE